MSQSRYDASGGTKQSLTSLQKDLPSYIDGISNATIEGNYFDMGCGRAPNVAIGSDGVEYSSQYSAIADHIFGLVANETYKFFGTTGINIVFYDISKKYLSGLNLTNYATFVVPNNSVSYRISCRESDYGKVNIIKSTKNVTRYTRDICIGGNVISNAYKGVCRKGGNIYISGDIANDTIIGKISSALSDGINSIAIIASAIMTSDTASTFYDVQSKVLTQLAYIVDYCNTNGIYVMLRISAYGANIDPHPADIATWFTNYRTIIDQFMNVVYPKSVHEIHIFNEMEYIQNNSATSSSLTSLISGLKSSYPNVIWGCDFNAYDTQMLNLDKFDVIGFNVYPEISRTANLTDDLIIKKGFHSDLRNSEFVRVINDLIEQNPLKDIVITEIGTQSEDKGLFQTWANSYSPSTPNQYTQKAYYSAWMDTFYRGCLSLKGIYVYTLLDGSSTGNGYEFFGKEAEKIIQEYWGG